MKRVWIHPFQKARFVVIRHLPDKSWVSQSVRMWSFWFLANKATLCVKGDGEQSAVHLVTECTWNKLWQIEKRDYLSYTGRSHHRIKRIKSSYIDGCPDEPLRRPRCLAQTGPKGFQTICDTNERLFLIDHTRACLKQSRTHSVRELWTHSDLLSERNERKSPKNSSERSITESSMSRTPYRGQRSGFTASFFFKVTYLWMKWSDRRTNTIPAIQSYPSKGGKLCLVEASKPVHSLKETPGLTSL